MEKSINILALIRQKKASIILGSILVAALSFAFLLSTQKNFKVSTDFLIVQNQSSQDFYTQSKSAEYLGKILNEAVYSELFIDEVAKTGKVYGDFLPLDKKDKLLTWSKMIQVNRNAELGIITVEVFNNDSNQALRISDAIAQVLTTENSMFRGDGQNIEIKVLSGPVLEKNPSITNIVATMLAGFILGFILISIFVYYAEVKRVRVAKFKLANAGNVIYQSGNDTTKQRMEMSGIFAQDESNINFENLER